jgi:hypothetical protein
MEEAGIGVQPGHFQGSEQAIGEQGVAQAEQGVDRVFGRAAVAALERLAAFPAQPGALRYGRKAPQVVMPSRAFIVF